MKYIIPGLILSLLIVSSLHAWQPATLQPEPVKPRVLISSDIGGTITNP